MSTSTWRSFAVIVGDPRVNHVWLGAKHEARDLDLQPRQVRQTQNWVASQLHLAILCEVELRSVMCRGTGARSSS